MKNIMKQINPLFDIRWHKENHFRPAFAFDCDILLLCYNRRVLVIFITETENDKNSFNVLVVPCSSCPEVFSKEGVLENFSKFTGKHQWQCLFLNKVASLRPATSLKKDFGTGVFLQILQDVQEQLFTEHIRWLLL